MAHLIDDNIEICVQLVRASEAVCAVDIRYQSAALQTMIDKPDCYYTLIINYTLIVTAADNHV